MHDFIHQGIHAYPFSTYISIMMYYPLDSDSESAVARAGPAAPPSLDTPLSPGPGHTDSVISVSVTTDSHSLVLLFLEENVWSELGRPIRHRLGLVIGAQPLNDNKSDEQKVSHYSFLFDS